MITQMYYYNYYKPHIIKNSDVKKVDQVPFRKTSFSSQTQNATGDSSKLNMTKAYKGEVLDYFTELTTDVNQIKSSLVSINKNIKDIDRNLKYSGVESTKDDIIIDMEDLTQWLNEAKKFPSNGEKSKQMQTFVKENEELISKNERLLKSVGISFEGDEFKFNPTIIENLDKDKLSNRLKRTKEVFEKFTENTNEVLSVPMSEHMDFKDFSYYFNYNLGIIQKDSFNIINTGTILSLEL